MVWLRTKSDFLDFSLPQVEQFLQDIKLCSSRRIGGVRELRIFNSLGKRRQRFYCRGIEGVSSFFFDSSRRQLGVNASFCRLWMKKVLTL